jgi:predicted metal-dependent enzyme (double-stranded beta helix superfamily)
MSFDVETFVERCRAAVPEKDAPQQIAAIVLDAIADPEGIAEAIRQRQEGQLPPPMANLFVNNEELTIYHLAFPTHLYGVPHDHAGWAVIGVYKGAEAFNTFVEEDGKLVRRGRQVIEAPSVEILPSDLIHDIENAGSEPSGSIHVYSNRHFDMPARRIWRDESAAAEPFTMERSYAYGMERTNRIRLELGMNEASMPVVPRIDAADDH